jgi:VWFA-related protein
MESQIARKGPGRGMRRTAVVAMLATSCLAGAAQGPTPPRQRPPLSLVVSQLEFDRWPTLGAYVSVVEASGASVTGLLQSNFEVVVDGQRARHDVSSLVDPASASGIVLVLDHSFSMAGQKIAGAREAAIDFVARAAGGQRIEILGFGTTIEVMQPLTENKALLRAALDGLVARGKTALRDALVAAASDLQKAGLKRRAVVVLTDGNDTSSRRDPGTTLELLRKENTPVYCIGLGKDADLSFLGSVAEATGGTMFAIENESSLLKAYQTVAGQITSQYAFRITPAAWQPNTVHSLQITVHYGGVSATGERLVRSGLAADAGGGGGGGRSKTATWWLWMVAAGVGGLLLITPVVTARRVRGAVPGFVLVALAVVFSLCCAFGVGLVVVP